MRLDEIMSLRATVGAGLLVTATDRCPLHCAHCSSASTLRGRDLDTERLLTFLRGCGTADRPEVVLFTGGEPLLRPDLIGAATEILHAIGAKVAVLTGAFFLRGNRIPAPIRELIPRLDQVSVSLDVFHEREVARARVFDLLRLLLELGVATSLHVVGDDPYLAEATDAVTAEFGPAVPMLVSEVRAVGRAKQWLTAREPDAPGIAPCAMAAWPVITADGVITACCNQDVVDGRARPRHLVLGSVQANTWPVIRDRLSRQPLLRVIRAVGPDYLAGSCGDTSGSDTCARCQRFGASTEAGRLAARIGAGPVGELLELTAIQRQTSAGAVGFVRRYGSQKYAALVGGDST